MNIPSKCEDLHLKIAELERREAALREELDRTKKAYEAYGIDFDRSEEKAAALQQRLAVAEQLLREVQKAARKQDWASGYPEIFSRVDAALKPAEEGDKS